jgi:prepilin-type N-terminal cleavage/methylation domain-containing protein
MGVRMQPRRLHESARAGRPSARRQDGFSLIELMVVVTITGVLAAIAMPTFTSYIQRARTSEAVQFLGVIKLRQEAYRAEFGGYQICAGRVLPSALAADDFLPALTQMTNARSVAFPTDASDARVACFNEIGAKPDGAVRFGYAWAAGPPGQLAGAELLYGIDATTRDHYFIAQAQSDLDGDGIRCVFELTSFTRNIWIGQSPGNTALAAGWE